MNLQHLQFLHSWLVTPEAQALVEWAIKADPWRISLIPGIPFLCLLLVLALLNLLCAKNNRDTIILTGSSCLQIVGIGIAVLGFLDRMQPMTACCWSNVFALTGLLILGPVALPYPSKWWGYPLSIIFEMLFVACMPIWLFSAMVASFVLAYPKLITHTTDKDVLEALQIIYLKIYDIAVEAFAGLSLIALSIDFLRRVLFRIARQPQPVVTENLLEPELMTSASAQHAPTP